MNTLSNFDGVGIDLYETKTSSLNWAYLIDKVNVVCDLDLYKILNTTSRVKIDIVSGYQYTNSRGRFCLRVLVDDSCFAWMREDMSRVTAVRTGTRVHKKYVSMKP